MTQNPNLAALSAAGVSVWLDDLSRERLQTGNLQNLIDTKSVVGVTTNPSIFQKAFADGNDYQGTSGTVTFIAGGSNTATVNVTVYADKAVEPNEIFDLNLSIPNAPGFNNYTLGTATGIGTIVNDD